MIPAEYKESEKNEPRDHNKHKNNPPYLLSGSVADYFYLYDTVFSPTMPSILSCAYRVKKTTIVQS